jgi:hypothetical protein
VLLYVTLTKQAFFAKWCKSRYREFWSKRESESDHMSAISSSTRLGTGEENQQTQVVSSTLTRHQMA